MSQPTPTNSNIDYVAGQVSPRTPDGVIFAIAIQFDRIDEAKKRIDTEGIVVRDMKGSVIPHPAIKIEQDATKMAADLLMKHRK